MHDWTEENVLAHVKRLGVVRCTERITLAIAAVDSVTQAHHQNVVTPELRNACVRERFRLTTMLATIEQHERSK